jgi:pyruvate,water dikinase
MMEKPLVLSLEDPRCLDPSLVGFKASNLARALKEGFPVPPGFCLTTFASQLLRENRELPQLKKEIEKHLQSLPPGQLAVRSSATVEDSSSLSFAGQASTFLNVPPERLDEAITNCLASLNNPQALSYRTFHNLPTGEMAIFIQLMVPAEKAGVAFTRDPVTGEEVVVIEAVEGLGEALVSGAAQPERYQIGKGEEPQGGKILSAQEVKEVAEMALALERTFGSPQDVEWCYREGELFLLQSRPLTVEGSLRRKAWLFFTEPGGEETWTSGFFNERFSEPLSPLGWSIIKPLVEELAFRDPLRYMGFRDAEKLRATRLYFGRPYVNLAIFQRIYRPFPDFLLPEGARGYFPNGNAGLRKAIPLPLLFPISLLRYFFRDPLNWSPLNWWVWKRYTSLHRAQLQSLRSALDSTDNPAELWSLMEKAQALNRRLLSIHRWSLTWADISYGLLKLFLRFWLKPREATKVASELLSGLGTKTADMGQALRELLHSPEQEKALRDFLRVHGHRSFSLDIYRPTFAEEPEQVLKLASSLEPRRESGRAKPLVFRDPFRGVLLALLLALAKPYALLREEQRFYWQEILAFMRQTALKIGKVLENQGKLSDGSLVFFLTWGELREACLGKPVPLPLAQARRAVFRELEEADPAAVYPLFLQGDKPMGEKAAWEGIPVSPGIASGPAKVVLTPSGLDKVQPGDILVVRAIDPGWTVVFGKIKGLVMEVGGQLSHGAVVAREYNIPAVTGVKGATSNLRDGQEVIVDGYTGRVIPQ